MIKILILKFLINVFKIIFKLKNGKINIKQSLKKKSTGPLVYVLNRPIVWFNNGLQAFDKKTKKTNGLQAKHYAMPWRANHVLPILSKPAKVAT